MCVCVCVCVCGYINIYRKKYIYWTIGSWVECLSMAWETKVQFQVKS